MDPALGDLQEGRKAVACAGIDGHTEHWEDPAPEPFRGEDSSLIL